MSSVIRGLKIGVVKWCREHNCEYFAWQKSFYDHIIRNEKSVLEIKKYITGLTAAEIVSSRVDSQKENMGSTNWKGEIITREQAQIVLNDKEILNNCLEYHFTHIAKN